MNLLKREQIKDRMIRLASEHWNIPENEIEANFDPLLMLMFDAIAGEMEAVGYQIRDIQYTLLDEISTLMLPQALLRAKPASCILTAQPSEQTCIINKEHNFSSVAQTQKVGEPVKDAELNFTPIGEVKLYKASLGFIRIGNKVYKYNAGGRKVLIHDDYSGETVNEIHFTIYPKEPFSSLEGMQIFFDLKGHSEARNFYFSLQNAGLLINGKKTVYHKGYHKNNQYQPDIKDAFNKDGDYSRKIQKEIAAIYEDQFITLQESAFPLSVAENTISAGLPEKLVQEINTPHAIYFTLQLSHPFPQEVLERLQIGVNAFPAINRRLEKINFTTDKWINIIPLPIKGSYLDIHNIESVSGTRYKIQLNNEDGKVDEGQAIIRAARVGKNSSHEVRNTIKSLLEAIRDESAYFSRTSNDFIASRLNEISKILTRLEDQMQLSKDEKPDFRYVLLKAKNAGENIHVHYWTTAPQDAAFVKASAGFKPVMHTLTDMNSIYSLTTAIGGEESHSEYAQKQMLVRQLSSRGKIISIEDIKLLCYELFGIKLKSVEVQKAMRIMPGSRSGISRVINISITVAKNDFTEDDLVYLEKQLRYNLDKHASFMFPFEIEIKEL